VTSRKRLVNETQKNITWEWFYQFSLVFLLTTCLPLAKRTWSGRCHSAPHSPLLFLCEFLVYRWYWRVPSPWPNMARGGNATSRHHVGVVLSVFSCFPHPHASLPRYWSYLSRDQLDSDRYGSAPHSTLPFPCELFVCRWYPRLGQRWRVRPRSRAELIIPAAPPDALYRPFCDSAIVIVAKPVHFHQNPHKSNKRTGRGAPVYFGRVPPLISF
jgi:hypothetical protein